MDKFEEVKEILERYFSSFTASQLSTHHAAKEICDLFDPQPSESPMFLDTDGQWKLRPKPDEKLPYLGAVWSDRGGECFWCKTPTNWLDLDYQGYVCSQRCQNEIAKDVETRSKPESNEKLEKAPIIPAQSILAENVATCRRDADHLFYEARYKDWKSPLELIGWMSPEARHNEEEYQIAKSKEGWVKLSEDQTLPLEICQGCSCYFKPKEQEILPKRLRDAGWRKVEVEKDANI